MRGGRHAGRRDAGRVQPRAHRGQGVVVEVEGIEVAPVEGDLHAFVTGRGDRVDRVEEIQVGEAEGAVSELDHAGMPCSWKTEGRKAASILRDPRCVVVRSRR